MCFHFRHSWPLRMWTSSSLQRSGNAWTLLRGPCTGMWWRRPTGTCCLWVRIASLWSWNVVWGYLCIFPLCLLAAHILLDWVHSLVDSDLKILCDWHQMFKLMLSSGDLRTVWYTSFSTAWVFIKLISNFKISNPRFLPRCSWLSGSWRGARCVGACVLSRYSRAWLCDPVDRSPPAPLSMAFSSQEYWSRFPCPRPGGSSLSGVEPTSPAWQVDTLPLCPGEAQVSVYYTVYYTVSCAFRRMQIVN